MDHTIASRTPLTRPAPATVLELLKPITWFAPMWAFGCGIVSAGVLPSTLGYWVMIAGGILLAGPLVCGTSQAVNDWFDRHVDAINEPKRPIPSGRMPGRWGLWVALVTSALALLLAALLGPVVLAATLLGVALAWAYSAPPLRLKKDGWGGNSAVAICYEGLPWVTGAAIMVGGVPDWRVFLLALLYSVGAHGIMTLNDFKSVSGDVQMGIRSIPVRLGVERAARFACWVMALPQVVVIGLLLAWSQWLVAALVTAVLFAQALLMIRLLKDPREHAPWYNATGTTLYVLGMLASAFALAAIARAGA